MKTSITPTLKECFSKTVTVKEKWPSQECSKCGEPLNPGDTLHVYEMIKGVKTLCNNCHTAVQL